MGRHFCKNRLNTRHTSQLGDKSETGPGIAPSLALIRVSEPRVRLAAFAAVAAGAGALIGYAGWPRPHSTLELSALIAASALTSALAIQRSAARDWATMPPSFVVSFASLLLLGPDATMLVAAAGIIAHEIADAPSPRPAWLRAFDAAMGLLAIQVAGIAYFALGGTLGHLSWPREGLPIAGAVLAYCVIKILSAEVVAPLFSKQAIKQSWPAEFLVGCPNYFIGASLAVVAVELNARQAWELVPLVALPVYCAFRVYSTSVARLEETHRRREVLDSIEEGMGVVDASGAVTLWSEALERILECPRDRALGKALTVAVPALAKTEVPRVIAELAANRAPRTLAAVRVPLTAGVRAFQVRLLPVTGGVTLLWQDVTDREQEAQGLKRSEERLALAAQGANDALWEWDLRSQELFVSARWGDMLGLPATAHSGAVEEWISRVHADDVAGLKAAFDAHLKGETDRIEHEHRLRHLDGSYRRFLCRGVAMRTAGGRATRVAGSLTDTTERAIVQERLRTAGFVDPLTGLCNRSVFVEGLGQRLDEFKHRDGGRFAVLYLDLDRFKVVNDSLGHLVGDDLLIAASRRLESCLRQGDALARLGGDEFAILLSNLNDEQQANAIAFRIQEGLSAPFSIGGREVFISASIGIAFGLAQYNNPEEIMRDADTAMYQAKSRGKARHEVFDADMHARARDRVGLESDLRHAVQNHAFEVHYQPIVSLSSRKCVGFESLVRWSRNGEPVSPAIFVPIAEELGLIEPLGTWIMYQACRTFAEWQRRMPEAGLDYITVNVSSRQLMQPNFPRIVEDAVDATGLKPSDLRLEITETALMDNASAAARMLSQLRDFGVKVYLDDFGTGYSSLSHLVKLPVDALKIDRSFVNSLLLPDRPAIVESILALARTLNTSVVAEGIETDMQASELERLGCTHAQGYLFSRPLSPSKAEELLIANQPLGPKGEAVAVAAAGFAREVHYPTATTPSVH